MSASSACSQCGATANPTNRFCNTCGSPLQRPAAQAPQGAAPQAPPPPAYGAPPAPYAPQQQPQGYPPPQGAYPGQQPQYQPPAPQQGARCQVGHEIAPGASYCAQGHPIALDAMQFANDPNAYARAGGAAPGQPAQGYGQPAPSPFDAQRGAPPPAQPGFGMGAPQQPQYAPPQPQAYAPPPQYAQPAPQPIFQPAAAPPPGMQPQYAPPPAPPVVPADTRPEPPPGTRMLRGFLVSFQSNPAGEYWPLGTGRVTIGRANAGDPAEIPLADATISSRHAAFMVDAATIVIEDTGSTNGTYVNEEPLGPNGRRELRDGDRVRFGGFTTLVKILGRL